LWLQALNARGLSQGDILKDVPIGATRVPLTFVSHAVHLDRRQKNIWTQYDALQPIAPDDPSGHWLAKGRIMHALVLTHNCDLDDIKDSERLLVAPISHISRVTSSDVDRQRIMQGARATYVPLRDVPGIGDCYADLRSICPLDRHLFSNGSRICSMTDDAVLILRAQLIIHFTGLEPEHLAEAMKAQLAKENQS